MNENEYKNDKFRRLLLKILREIEEHMKDIEKYIEIYVRIIEQKENL